MIKSHLTLSKNLSKNSTNSLIQQIVISHLYVLELRLWESIDREKNTFLVQPRGRIPERLFAAFEDVLLLLAGRGRGGCESDTLLWIADLLKVGQALLDVGVIRADLFLVKL